MSTATAWQAPTYQPASIGEMSCDELVERKDELQRLTRRYRTTDTEFAQIDEEWHAIVAILQSAPATRSRTVPRRSDPAAELARELKQRKRSLAHNWRITDTTVELRSPEYPDQVAVSAEARDVIEDAVYHSRVGALETGGPLGGHWASRHRMRVTSARGAGSARRGYNWIELGAELYQFEVDVDDTPGVDLIGGWHSHPSGRARPSETDLVTWAKTLDGVERRNGTTTWIGMIATPSRDWQSGIGRMAMSDLHAWLLRRISPSLVTRERADVVVTT